MQVRVFSPLERGSGGGGWASCLEWGKDTLGYPYPGIGGGAGLTAKRKLNPRGAR